MAISELGKLQRYLNRKKYDFERQDKTNSYARKLYFEELAGSKYITERHQIRVYKSDEKAKVWFDVICHYGSYGFEQGLLEIMADDKRLVDTPDGVEGYLTASEIIARLEGLK